VSPGCASIQVSDHPTMSSEDEYTRVVEELLADPAVVETHMMGMPSLKAGTKLFAGIRGEALLAKLGRDRVDELIAAGRAQPFDPSGRDRPMKDWALLPPPADDWSALAAEARRFVA
jgi:hypothetical protein